MPHKSLTSSSLSALNSGGYSLWAKNFYILVYFVQCVRFYILVYFVQEWGYKVDSDTVVSPLLYRLLFFVLWSWWGLCSAESQGCLPQASVCLSYKHLSVKQIVCYILCNYAYYRIFCISILCNFAYYACQDRYVCICGRRTHIGKFIYLRVHVCGF